jgi:hypothetical protein
MVQLHVLEGEKEALKLTLRALGAPDMITPRVARGPGSVAGSSGALGVVAGSRRLSGAGCSIPSAPHSAPHSAAPSRPHSAGTCAMNAQCIGAAMHSDLLSSLQEGCADGKVGPVATDGGSFAKGAGEAQSAHTPLRASD